MNRQPLYAVTRGQWGFPDDEFYDRVERIVQAGRDLWNTHDFPYYLVALLPTDELLDVSGGEGRTNGVSLYLPKDLTTLSDRLHLFAHELFHAWNPQRLGGFEEVGGVEDERLYWFSEGFTDYYASLLLLRAGLISLDDYLARYNSSIKDYYASPVRLLTAAEMVQKRRTNGDAERLFYQGGCLLAQLRGYRYPLHNKAQAFHWTM